MSLKTYMQMVSVAWRNKDGPAVAELLSYKHHHAKNSNLYYSNAEYDIRSYLTSPADEVVIFHVRVIHELKNNDINQAFSYQLMLTNVLSKLLQSCKEDNWLLAVVNKVALELRLLAFRIDSGATRGQSKSREALEKSADALMVCFRACTTDNRSGVHDSKKWAMMSLVNQLFKVYFRINKLNLMRPLIRAIDTSAFKDKFPLSHQITYKYFVGRKAMFDSDFTLANEYLTFAFERCHMSSKKNKRLILFCLAPVKMLLGYMPKKSVMQKYNVMELWEVADAVKKGRINQIDRVMLKNQTLFIKHGIYLILEKLKIITYRNLFKKVYLCEKNHVIPMNHLLAALRLSEDSEIDLEEVHCIVANLIHENKIKGYISFQHQKLVLSKLDAFPKLITDSRSGVKAGQTAG